MRPFFTAVSIMLLVACGSAEPDGPAQSETPDASPPVESEAAAPPTEATAADSEAPVDEPSDPALVDIAVILQSDGIGVLTDADSTAQFPFPSDEQTVLTALETAFGAPTGDEQLDECGPGPLRAVSWEGFTAFFSDNGFDGWYVQEPQPETVTTAQGVGLGTTLAELQDAFGDLTVEESTIGTEWLGGGISGTLTEDSDSGTVDVMWAGANCIAR